MVDHPSVCNALLSILFATIEESEQECTLSIIKVVTTSNNNKWYINDDECRVT